MKKLCLLLIVLLLVPVFSFAETKLEKAEMLYEKNQYLEALDCFLSIDYKSEDYKRAMESIYSKGITFFENGQYELCKEYMYDIWSYKDAKHYWFVSATIDDINRGKNIDYAYTVLSLAAKSEHGFEPATQLLQKSVFADYLDLINMRGLYRSDDTTLRDLTLMKYDVYCYLNIDYPITSACYMKETVNPITGDDVDEKVEDYKFNCKCISLGESVYRCTIDYKDPFNGKSEQVTFVMYIEGEKLVVDQIETTEVKGMETIIEGTYTKIE